MLLNILIFSILISSVNESDNSMYSDALCHIKMSPEYTSLSKGKNKYYVSNELISFYTIGRFFKKELQGFAEVPEEDFISESGEIISMNSELLQLGTKKSAKLKLYFSEIKEDIFFCEILESQKKNVKYEERPHFGRSFTYMFKVENEEVKLLSTKEIAYN